MGGVGLSSVIFWMIFGYLLGSCPTGYVLVRYMLGEDIRNFGSGNIGATNVARVLGKKWAIATAVSDMLKGGIAILVAILVGVESPFTLALIGFMSVIGHDYPVWIGFKGGKGVATTFGVFAFYGFFNPLPALIGGLIWFAVRELWGYVSLGSMVSLGAAALLMPICGFDRSYYFFAVLLTLLTIWRHRENIKRLLAGSENRVGRIFLK